MQNAIELEMVSSIQVKTIHPIRMEEVNIIKQVAREAQQTVLFCVDCEGDDIGAMVYQHYKQPLSVAFFILVVSPSPEEHFKMTAKLFSILKSTRHVYIFTGARYDRSGFTEPKDDFYITAMNDFITGSANRGVTVYLLTTCYALMKHWRDEWESKINMVFNMGGEGVPSPFNEGGKNLVGFNWRVGNEWVVPFLEKIPKHRRILLEPVTYHSEFKTQFGEDVIVSLSPRSFPKFIERVAHGALFGGKVSTLLFEQNHAWVHNGLKSNKDRQKWYPQKGLEGFYFCPPDILLSVMSNRTELYDWVKVKTITIKDKQFEVLSIIALPLSWIDDELENCWRKIEVYK
jgi:hypothetical protein